jgi:hypothetical protein
VSLSPASRSPFFLRCASFLSLLEAQVLACLADKQILRLEHLDHERGKDARGSHGARAGGLAEGEEAQRGLASIVELRGRSKGRRGRRAPVRSRL